MIKQVTKFITEDGKEFDSHQEAQQYEFKKQEAANERYEHYIRTSWSGRRLIEAYALSTYGTWEILGEDSNADLGGHHHMPSLGIFEGTLEQVIRKAVSIPRFYSWGGGGDIRKHEIQKVERLG